MRVLLVLTFLSSDECNYNSWNFFWQLLGYWYGFFEFFLFFQSKSESHFLCLHFWNFAGTSSQLTLSKLSFWSDVLSQRQSRLSILRQKIKTTIEKLDSLRKQRKNLVKLWCKKICSVKIVKNQRCPFTQSSRITRIYIILGSFNQTKWVIWQSVVHSG